MASFFNIAARFRGQQQPRPGNSQRQPSPGGQASPSSPVSPGAGGSSTSLGSMSADNPRSPTGIPSSDNANYYQMRKTPHFFREENSGLIVKGNFMTLAAKPEHVEKGEWVAHQVVEQYRLLEALIKGVQEVDKKTGLALCNPHVCPTMNAGDFTYTWLDNNRNPVKIPASQYISLVQKWIMGKLKDPRIFPTDTNFSSLARGNQAGTPTTPGAQSPIPAGPTSLNMPLDQLSGREWLGKSSGFPENFELEAKNLYRQMFRCYGHLYYSHWIDPFFHLNSVRELNTCFLHFVNVGKLYDLLADRDLKPMQPLIDIWVAKGLLPKTPGPALAGSPTTAGSSAQNAAPGGVPTSASATSPSAVPGDASGVNTTATMG